MTMQNGHSTEIKVEHDVPIPVGGKGRKGEKYPFAKMAIGDSFFVQGGRNETRTSVLALVRRKYPDIKLTTALVEGGLRVWRIA
jgi:hypothetical protein